MTDLEMISVPKKIYDSLLASIELLETVNRMTHDRLLDAEAQLAKTQAELLSARCGL